MKNKTMYEYMLLFSKYLKNKNSLTYDVGFIIIIFMLELIYLRILIIIWLKCGNYQ
jgi:hypothetical protein